MADDDGMEIYRQALTDARNDLKAALVRQDAAMAEAEALRLKHNRLAFLVRSLRDIVGESEPSDEALPFIPEPPRRRIRRGGTA